MMPTATNLYYAMLFTAVLSANYQGDAAARAKRQEGVFYSGGANVVCLPKIDLCVADD